MRLRLPWRRPRKYVPPKPIADIIDVEDTSDGLVVTAQLREGETLPDYAFINSTDFKSLYGGNMDVQDSKDFYEQEARDFRKGLCVGLILGAALWSIIIALIVWVVK